MTEIDSVSYALHFNVENGSWGWQKFGWKDLMILKQDVVLLISFLLTVFIHTNMPVVQQRFRSAIARVRYSQICGLEWLGCYRVRAECELTGSWGSCTSHTKLSTPACFTHRGGDALPPVSRSSLRTQRRNCWGRNHKYVITIPQHYRRSGGRHAYSNIYRALHSIAQ